MQLIVSYQTEHEFLRNHRAAVHAFLWNCGCQRGLLTLLEFLKRWLLVERHCTTTTLTAAANHHHGTPPLCPTMSRSRTRVASNLRSPTLYQTFSLLVATTNSSNCQDRVGRATWKVARIAHPPASPGHGNTPSISYDSTSS